MLNRYPKCGDLIKLDKRWFWHRFDYFVPKKGLKTRYSKLQHGSQNDDQLNVTLELGYAPYVPIQVTSIRITPDMPIDQGLFVVAASGPTLIFLYENDLFYVKAGDVQHIMDDFTMLSSIDEAK